MKVRHYKGGIYHIMVSKTEIDTNDSSWTNGVLRGVHTETGEHVFAHRQRDNKWYSQDGELVFYMDEHKNIWARPHSMFWEHGYFNDPSVLEPRFEIIQ